MSCLSIKQVHVEIRKQGAEPHFETAMSLPLSALERLPAGSYGTMDKFYRIVMAIGFSMVWTERLTQAVC